jgi:hypothetical protein
MRNEDARTNANGGDPTQSRHTRNCSHFVDYLFIAADDITDNLKSQFISAAYNDKQGQ